MERDSVLEYTNNREVYTNKFKEGYNAVLSSNGAVKVREEDVDYSNLESIGYYDGAEYGSYCIEVHQANNMNNEHFTAVVEKAYSRAFDSYWEATSKNPAKK